MKTYILKVKDSADEKKLPKNLRCFTKVVNADGIRIARSIAAKDAEKMVPFDAPNIWLNSRLSTCINAKNYSYGMIAAEYA
jgi:hypothetical protein